MQAETTEFDMMKIVNGQIHALRKFTVSEGSARYSLAVTERHYFDGQTGERLMRVFDGEYESLDEAKVDFVKQGQTVKDEGFVENRTDVSKYGL